MYIKTLDEDIYVSNDREVRDAINNYIDIQSQRDLGYEEGRYRIVPYTVESMWISNTVSKLINLKAKILACDKFTKVIQADLSKYKKRMKKLDSGYYTDVIKRENKKINSIRQEKKIAQNNFDCLLDLVPETYMRSRYELKIESDFKPAIIRMLNQVDIDYTEGSENVMSGDAYVDFYNRNRTNFKPTKAEQKLFELDKSNNRVFEIDDKCNRTGAGFFLSYDYRE